MTHDTGYMVQDTAYMVNEKVVTEVTGTLVTVRVLTVIVVTCPGKSGNQADNQSL